MNPNMFANALNGYGCLAFPYLNTPCTEEISHKINPNSVH